MSECEAPGRLEVITGPMFSGKSEELIRRLRRAEIARLRVLCLKPEIDTRFGREAIASHSRQRLEALPVRTVEEMRAAVVAETGGPTGTARRFDVIGVDEAQFFDRELVGQVEAWVRAGYRVVAAGLDMTFAGEPFGPVPALMAIADEVVKLSAVCMVCGAPAVHSQRLSGDMNTVLVGAGDAYEARCRLHFDPAGEIR